MQRGFQFPARAEMVALQDVLDPAVEALDLAFGFRVLRRGQTMLDAQVAAQRFERVLSGGGAFAQAEQAVGEFFPARHRARTNGAFNGSLRRYRADTDRTGPFEIAQAATTSAIGSSPMAWARVGGGLGIVDADEHPAGRPVDGHKQVTPRRFISHLRQIPHIDGFVA